MKNLLLTLIISTFLVACTTANTYQDSTSFNDQHVTKQKIGRDTVNMSEYDKQRYYSEHHLGIYQPMPRFNKR